MIKQNQLKKQGKVSEQFLLKGQCYEIFDFASGVVDTGGKVAAGIVDTSGTSGKIYCRCRRYQWCTLACEYLH
jgi:hypothetical protein